MLTGSLVQIQSPSTLFWLTGCSSVAVEHCVRYTGVISSNLITPTKLLDLFLGEIAQMCLKVLVPVSVSDAAKQVPDCSTTDTKVERRAVIPKVAGSNPVFLRHSI